MALIGFKQNFKYWNRETSYMNALYSESCPNFVETYQSFQDTQDTVLCGIIKFFSPLPPRETDALKHLVPVMLPFLSHVLSRPLFYHLSYVLINMYTYKCCNMFCPRLYLRHRLEGVRVCGADSTPKHSVYNMTHRMKMAPYRKLPPLVS